MKGILFGSFGTTCDEARARQIDGVARALEAVFAPAPVVQCFTSDMVRGILHRRGVSALDVSEGLQRLAHQGVREVVVQPGHLLPGNEYDKLCRRAQEHVALFDNMCWGAPLLASEADMEQFATMLDQQFPVSSGEAYVLMGHGTSQFVNIAYAALDYRLKAKGRTDMFVGAVESYPSLETVLGLLKQQQFHTVHLAPLMLVAGDHAHNDMAGQASDSWANRLRVAGYDVVCHLIGLGELPAVQALYVSHVKAAWVG